MNWDAIGAVGEILGAAAVVATLVYLAIQVRYAKDASADVNRLSRAEGVRETIAFMAKDSKMAKAWIGAQGSLAQYEKLAKSFGLEDIEDGFNVEYVCQSWWWLHWGQWASITTERDMNELRHLVSELYSQPPMSIAWQESANVVLLEPEFRQFVDDAIATKEQSLSATDSTGSALRWKRTSATPSFGSGSVFGFQVSLVNLQLASARSAE